MMEDMFWNTVKIGEIGEDYSIEELYQSFERRMLEKIHSEVVPDISQYGGKSETIIYKNLVFERTGLRFVTSSGLGVVDHGYGVMSAFDKNGNEYRKKY